MKPNRHPHAPPPHACPEPRFLLEWTASSGQGVRKWEVYKLLSRIEKIAKTISLVLFGLILVAAGVLVGASLLRFKEDASDDASGHPGPPMWHTCRRL